MKKISFKPGQRYGSYIAPRVQTSKRWKLWRLYDAFGKTLTAEDALDIGKDVDPVPGNILVEFNWWKGWHRLNALEQKR